MSKALSLKKTQHNHLKNQKAITQFFKTIPCSHENESPNSNQEVTEIKLGTTTLKRKASSSEVEKVISIHKNDVDKIKTVNSSKKLKPDNKHDDELNKNRLSLQMGCTTIQSPRKEHVTKKLFIDNNKSLGNSKKQNELLVPLTDNKIQGNISLLDGKPIEKVDSFMQNIIERKVENNVVCNGKHSYVSPKKIAKATICVSPKSTTLTTQKCDNSSPSKCGSTPKTFNENDFDMFDNWELDVEEDTQDLDLNVMQRCEILSVKRHDYKLELKLKNANNNKGTCFVEGIWLNTPLEAREIISVLAPRDFSGSFVVNNTSGLLVLRPDHLISSTSVVSGVFCKRKAVLQERCRGIDSANTAMTIGILIHELVQKALTQNIVNATTLGSETDRIIKESIQMLYDAGLTETEARSNMQMYIQPLAAFMQTYVDSSAKALLSEKRNWNGKIEKVLDIEENVCCPQLGLKGKIDATLQVSTHEGGDRRTTVMPLELKSGRASVSAEHRGQLVLYGMMLSLQRQDDPATSLQRGLLLYLKERIDLREVSCGYPERRDLMMLRNELAQHLASGPRSVEADQLVDIEDASRLLQQSLPEPVHHQTACSKCPYLTLCSLHLWHTEGPTVSESHPLAKLRNEAIGHLSPRHIKYFMHWVTLLKLEEKGQPITSPLHALWTQSVENRYGHAKQHEQFSAITRFGRDSVKSQSFNKLRDTQSETVTLAAFKCIRSLGISIICIELSAKRGVCAANLKLKSVTSSGEKFSHIFVRQSTNAEDLLSGDKAAKGPQEGEYSIVSVENRPWIAAGVITLSNNNELHLLLERDLSRRLNKDTPFHIDTYESFATTVQNLTNLGVLMEDSDRAFRLRNLIIDKAPPEFAPKLPREVGRMGLKLMRALNIEQQRAVLKALSCEHYVLLRGLPGTGKTQTIGVLIQMLVGLKQRVLVTAHTHSAVDTVLKRLPESLRVMRLGTASRVANELVSRCEHTLAHNCHSTEQLAQLYDSTEVVGVTCLGATHPMLARTTFDVCIVDEATQVLQCTVLRPLFAAKRFVLVGDPEQLPPVVRSRSARRLGMEESLFHRLVKDDATCTLKLQYRMNQALVDVANKVAYDNNLKCADQGIAQAKLEIDMQKICHLTVEYPWLIPACSPEFENAAIFLNTIVPFVEPSNHGKVFTNNDEACVVMVLVESLKQGGVIPSDIGIIAPYRDQVSLLRRVLLGKDVEVSTVDQFQGRDKRVIIYSCTRREENDDRPPKEGEVLNDHRRLAVSVTRAKHKLIVIGNLRALQRYAPLLKLVESCKVITLEEDIVTKLNKKYGALVT